MSRETRLPTTRRGGISVERAIRFAPGVALMRQRFEGDDLRVIVTHEGSLRAIVEVHAGELHLGVTRALSTPSRFVLSVPPRSVLAMRFRAAIVSSDGAGAPRALDRHHVPTLETFELGNGVRPSANPHDDAADDPRIIRRVLATIDPDDGVPAAIAFARRALHDHLGDAAPVRRVAQLAGMAPETLTRAFTQAYGIAPKAYCHRARLFDAALRLLDGASILETALRVGFNDLTRFYAQFRGVLGATPGRYARIRNRQDAGDARS